MPLSDMLGASDSQLGNIIFFGAGLSGSIYTGNFSDTFSFSESYTLPGLTLSQSISESVILSETITGRRFFNVSLSDSVNFTDLISSTTFYSVFGDTLSLSETVTRVAFVSQPISESLSLNETWTAYKIGSVELSDTTFLIDSFSYDVVLELSLSDSLSLTDAAYRNQEGEFDDTVSFTEDMSGGRLFNRLTADMMPLADNVTAVITSNRTISETLTLTETMTGVATIPLVPDTITFSETMTGVASKLFSDTLSISEEITLNRVINKSLSDALTITETLTRNIVLTKTLSDTVTFAENLVPVHVKSAEFSDTLSWSEELYRERYSELVDTSIALSDTFVGQKVATRTLTDTLTFTETCTRTTNFGRPLSDEVIIIDGFIARVKKSSGQPPNTSVTPVIPPPGSYTPAPINEGVIGIRRLVLIEGFNRSIVLPPPEFNDFESFDNQLSVQRSMSGQYKTYKKSSDRIRNNWHWILPKPKADELRAFIDAEDSTLLTITDWRGYIWKAYLLTDSIDFAEIRRWQPCGNAVDVTLEFIGTRYA